MWIPKSCEYLFCDFFAKLSAFHHTAPRSLFVDVETRQNVSSLVQSSCEYFKTFAFWASRGSQSSYFAMEHSLRAVRKVRKEEGINRRAERPEQASWPRRGLDHRKLAKNSTRERRECCILRLLLRNLRGASFALKFWREKLSESISSLRRLEISMKMRKSLTFCLLGFCLIVVEHAFLAKVFFSQSSIGLVSFNLLIKIKCKARAIYIPTWIDLLGFLPRDKAATTERDFLLIL